MPRTSYKVRLSKKVKKYATQIVKISSGTNIFVKLNTIVETKCNVSVIVCFIVFNSGLLLSIHSFMYFVRNLLLQIK